jgi:hypothetical protein
LLTRLLRWTSIILSKLVVQKFERGRVFTFASPSPGLAEAIDTGGSRVYLQIDMSAAGEVS